MKEFSAILLAGGKSSRMGTDKASLPFGDGTMLERQAAKLIRIGIGDVMISGGKTAVEETRRVADVYPGRGPLGGLHACLLAARFPDCLVLSVDMPLVPEKVLLALLEAHAAGKQPVTLLARGDRLQPLPGVYRRELAPVAARRLAEGDASLRGLIRETSCSLLPYRGPEELLMNCNTPEEYRRALFFAEAGRLL